MRQLGKMVYSLVFLAIPLVEMAITVSDNPCANAIHKKDYRRHPDILNTDGRDELCDRRLKADTWYFFGGEISRSCIDHNRCSTFAPAWYNGEYPQGEEIVLGRACSKWKTNNCCDWTGEMKVKNCSFGLIYQLAIPVECPISYCVGAATPCVMYRVHHKGVCYEVPKLRDPVLSEPYISGYKLFGLFNATTFSIDCDYTISIQVNRTGNGMLKIRVVFKMNEEVIAKFVVDEDTMKVTLGESYLVGHIGKQLLCEVQHYYEFPDGSISSGGDIRQSKEFYFGVDTVDSEGKVIEDITMEQSVTKEVYLKTSFPITFGHCMNESECEDKRYSFEVKSQIQGLQQSSCEVFLENEDGKMVYTSKYPLTVTSRVKAGREFSTDVLAFMPFKGRFQTTIFEGYVIPWLRVKVEDTQVQPLCRSTGNPHITTFSGLPIDNYESGDFNMLTSKSRKFQIQVRQIPCWGISCNCGLFVREGNNLIGITCCDHQRTPSVVNLMRDNVNPSAIIKKTNNEYEIKLVSGIKIIVSYRTVGLTLLDIYVHALKNEEYGGFCAAKTAPKDFSSFRITESESFFRKNMHSCVNETINVPHCECVATKNRAVICNNEHAGHDLEILNVYVICDLKGHHKRKKRNADSNPISYLFESSYARHNIEEIFKDINPDNDNKIPSEEKFVDVKESESQCFKAFEFFKYLNECIPLLGRRWEEIQKNCFDDVQLNLTGNLHSNFRCFKNYFVQDKQMVKTLLIKA